MWELVIALVWLAILIVTFFAIKRKTAVREKRKRKTREETDFTQKPLHERIATVYACFVLNRIHLYLRTFNEALRDEEYTSLSSSNELEQKHREIFVALFALTYHYLLGFYETKVSPKHGFPGRDIVEQEFLKRHGDYFEFSNPSINVETIIATVDRTTVATDLRQVKETSFSVASDIDMHQALASKKQDQEATRRFAESARKLATLRRIFCRTQSHFMKTILGLPEDIQTRFIGMTVYDLAMAEKMLQEPAIASPGAIGLTPWDVKPVEASEFHGKLVFGRGNDA